jgi:hypothetical protein
MQSEMGGAALRRLDLRPYLALPSLSVQAGMAEEALAECRIS